MERLIYQGKIPFSSAEDISHSRLGIGFEKLDRDVFDPNKAYDKVAAIGVKKIRLQSGWMKTEREEGKYEFAWLDEIVDKLRALGMEPWLCLSYGNPLYTPLAWEVFGAVGCPPVGSEREMNAWLRYVAATVAHFKGRVSLYEIWNEPDLPYSWKHEAGETPDLLRNAGEYGEFASKTAIIIKKTDTNAEVAAFGLGRASELQYPNAALATGLYRYIDYVTFHIYSPHDARREEIIRALAALVHSYNPNIRLIQGESGAQTRSDGHGAMKGFAWTNEKQVKMLLRTLICDLYCGVEFTSYFSTMDMIEALHGLVADKASYLDYGYFGVLSAEFDADGHATGDYSEKPSYYALQALAALLKGNVAATALPWGRKYLPSRRVNGTDCTDDTLRVYPFRLDDGTNILFYWNSTPILTTTYDGTLSLSVFGQKNDNIRLIDLRDGSIYKLPEGMIEELGCGGVLFRNLPLTDFPLAILFQ